MLKSSKHKKHPANLIIVFILIVCSLVAGVYWLNNETDSAPMKETGSTADSSTKGEQTSSNLSDNRQADMPVSNNNKGMDGKTLKEPSGNFVSNHRPSITNPQASAISSSCETTPKATCMISFTKDDKTIALDPKQADANGNVYWYWNLKDYGFSAGAWKITAKATLNGASLVSGDALEFTVAQ